MSYLHELNDSEMFRLRAKLEADCGKVLVVVHPFYLGVSESQIKWGIERARNQIYAMGGVFDRPPEDDLVHYQGYLQAFREFISQETLGVGLLVEASAEIERSLSRLGELNSNLEWLVLPTETQRDLSLPSGFTWEDQLAKLSSCGGRSADVCGAVRSSCVTNTANYLTAADMSAQILDAVSFDYVSKAK